MGTEEVISILVSQPTHLLSDNLGALQSVTKPGSSCQKKHMQVAYLFVRECQATGEISVMKFSTTHDILDAGTKALNIRPFWNLLEHVFSPDFA